ncbi:FAD-dependent oxidoreductase [Actinoplanes sp. TBRC 11911]|uniref:flavin monoamine oxidase family protein n=1 Tax=Actinoplanes sp. TBRC 11911 TaxID=2729386 RepID=UPI00145F5EC1|nr:NAD(P)/FAD-dependent oxidoreductase [Actinoplanes sp. TBRC 11911]NMO53688.1 FAD-dependent oxidoreductase [Actinoplanes sp. TBRC 11911]
MTTPDGLDEARWRVCLDLARDVLLLDSDGSDRKLRYLKVLIDEGLPRAVVAKRVLIVGAGIAGLAAGYLLKQAGHEVRIIEANPRRLGGRIKTFRDDPEHGMTSPFADPLQYAEAGAMRIPDMHPLTLALVDKFGLRRRPFYNVDVDAATGRPYGSPPPVIYRAATGEVWRNGPDPEADDVYEAPTAAGRTWVRVNGVQMRRSEYQSDPSAINESFSVREDLRGVPAGDTLDAALHRAYVQYHAATEGAGEAAEQVEAWARLIYELDDLSMSQFLTKVAGLDGNAIDAIGTLENITSRLPLAFVHSYMARSMINPSTRYWELEGGSWHLPYAFEPLLGEDVVFDRRVATIQHAVDGPGVTIEAYSEAGDSRETFIGDVAVITVPFSGLRHIEIEPMLSYAKRRAIIELHYDSATKVLLEFSRRWWEFTEQDWRRELDGIEPGLYDSYDRGTADDRTDLVGKGVTGEIPPRQRLDLERARDGGQRSHPADRITGGGSVTDNANRFMYYPSHPVPGSPGGVVLASYTWADDAARWDSMDDDDRYAYALRGMQEVHGNRIEVFYTGHGATQSWARNDFAFGEAAVFAPGQLVEHHPVIAAAEGPLHFAGEHTSLKHSWIEGALESAVRVALEINEGQ